MVENVFDKHATAADIMSALGQNAAGRTYFITGANAGIGYSTTRALLKAGATVIAGCRSEKKANAAVESLKQEVGAEKCSLHLVLMDLSDLESVSQVPAKLKALNVEAIDCLICNAGIMDIPDYRKTKQGYELQYGVNHVGHWFLCNLLKEFVAASEDKRIVLLSSIGHHWCSLPDPPNKCIYQDTEEEYHGMNTYGRAKLNNILTAVGINREFAEAGITAYSLHPGWVYQSELAGSDGCTKCTTCCAASIAFYCCADDNVKTLEQGAATSLVCALQDKSKLTAGGYYQCQNLAEIRGGRGDVDVEAWSKEMWVYMEGEREKFEA